MADISFQGQTNGSFNRSTTDMTFRPQSENRRASVQKEEYLGDIRSPLMPPKAEIKYDNREERTSSMKHEVRENRENKDSRR